MLISGPGFALIPCVPSAALPSSSRPASEILVIIQSSNQQVSNNLQGLHVRTVAVQPDLSWCQIPEGQHFRAPQPEDVMDFAISHVDVQGKLGGKVSSKQGANCLRANI